ncbi:MAG: LamG-like jellyroll fold domain-containing protein, partial [Candidatus Hodarchaeales archaeon]
MKNRYNTISILIFIFAFNAVFLPLSINKEMSSTSNSILVELLRDLGISQKEKGICQAVPTLTAENSRYFSTNLKLIKDPINISTGLSAKIQETGNTIEDYVDIKTNVDSNPDIGNHDSFTNLQLSDSIYDNITEEAGGVGDENTHSWDAPGGPGNYLQVDLDGLTDFGSVSGTISLWLKYDSINGRFWGQHDLFEVNNAYGNDIITLDFGNGNVLQYSHGMTTTNKWYFWAVTWDENTDTIIVYEGDENNEPSLVASTTSWIYNVSTVGVTENNIMNGGHKNGGDYEVNGHVDDFRYYDTSRSLAAIQNDYNKDLTGMESSLVHYYKFDEDLTDSASSIDCIEAGSGGSFSTDISSAFPSGGSGSNLYCWDNNGFSDAYLKVGDSGATDFGSSSGTISLWLNFWGTREGHFWGQHDSFEIRFSGDDLKLDFGEKDSLHYKH